MKQLVIILVIVVIVVIIGAGIYYSNYSGNEYQPSPYETTSYPSNSPDYSGGTDTSYGASTTINTSTTLEATSPVMSPASAPGYSY